MKKKTIYTLLASPFIFNFTLTIVTSGIAWYTRLFTGTAYYVFRDGETLALMWVACFVFAIPAVPFLDNLFTSEKHYD